MTYNFCMNKYPSLLMNYTNDCDGIVTHFAQKVYMARLKGGPQVV